MEHELQHKQHKGPTAETVLATVKRRSRSRTSPHVAEHVMASALQETFVSQYKHLETVVLVQ